MNPVDHLYPCCSCLETRSSGLVIWNHLLVLPAGTEENTVDAVRAAAAATRVVDRKDADIMKTEVEVGTPPPRGIPLAGRKTILTTSLGPGRATYACEAHSVEFELEVGSLKEELPAEVSITQGLAFVKCRTEEGSCRWDGWG